MKSNLRMNVKYDLFSGNSPSYAVKRLVKLLRHVGFMGTLSVCVSIIEDFYLKTFDRKYGVRTSGIISLRTTSVDPSKLRHATGYRAVNAWAFRRLLNGLGLPKTFHFADLGCGLGRACILAAEYGFAKVTGIEFAPELYEMARENVSAYQARGSPVKVPLLRIVQGDALDYCNEADEEVFFMYRPFSGKLLRSVLAKLVGRATQLNKALTIIYSERMLLPESDDLIFSEYQAFRKLGEWSWLGQMFYVYQCGVCDLEPSSGERDTITEKRDASLGYL